MLEGRHDKIPMQHLRPIEKALETWRQFLLDMRPHPGVFEQHLLPLVALESTNVPGMPRNMNRYVLRAVDMDIVTGERTALVYWKLPRFVVLGFVVNPEPRNSWVGTRAAVKRGQIRPRRYELPQTLMEYVMGQAQKAEDLTRSISLRQQELIDKATLNDLDRTRASESIKALIQDIQFFGLADFDSSAPVDDAPLPDGGGPRDAC